MIKLLFTIGISLLLAPSAYSVERAILSVKPHHKIKSKDLNLILDSSLIVSRKNLWSDKEDRKSVV